MTWGVVAIIVAFILGLMIGHFIGVRDGWADCERAAKIDDTFKAWLKGISRG
jgi:hypothetical protein